MEQAIKDFFESLHLHKKYVMEAGVIVGGIPMERLFNHDASKFTEAEYPYYARQFFGDKGDPDGFARAWLNHIHLNDHHWQHWIFPDGHTPKGSQVINGVMPMPEVCVREMVADWMGASFAYTGSWDMSDWLNSHYADPANKRVVLHPETDKLVWDILFSIGYREIDNSPLLALLDRSKYG